MNIIQPISSQPPVFIHGPLPWAPSESGPIIMCHGSLNLKQDQIAKLDVEVIGNPIPQLSWFLNDHPVTQDKAHKVKTFWKYIVFFPESFVLPYFYYS